MIELFATIAIVLILIKATSIMFSALPFLGLALAGLMLFSVTGVALFALSVIWSGWRRS